MTNLKCIKTEGFPHLTVGKVYPVVEVNEPPNETGACIVLDNGKMFFFMSLSKFEVV
jgi:hypothetical protein